MKQPQQPQPVHPAGGSRLEPARGGRNRRAAKGRRLRAIRLGLVLLATAVTWQCADSSTDPPSERGNAQLLVRADLANTSVTTVVLEVSAADIDPPLVFNLERNGDVAEGVIEIPAGSDRAITAYANDSQGVRTHEGSETLTVREGTNPTVSITLTPLAGEQPVKLVLGTILVIIAPGIDTVRVGEDTRFTAVITTSAGDTIDESVQWASLDSRVAVVDTTGLVTGVAPGDAEIVAVHGTVGGSARIHVDTLVAPPDDTIAPPPDDTLAVCPGAPYPCSQVISEIRFDWSTHRRAAPGSDNWPLTWADDGHQYTSWGDGGGFGGTNSNGRVDMGIARIEGGKSGYSGHNINGGDDPESGNITWPDNAQGMKTYALLSVDGGVLYTFLSPLSDVNNWNFARLARSTNRGASWTEISSVEFTEAEGLGLPWFLQAGQDYGEAEDDYIYVYFTEIRNPGIWQVQKPGEIALARVTLANIEQKGSYEFFAGFDDDGDPTWSSDRSRREPVFEDPNGVMRQSTIYNPVLDRYLMITSHTARNFGNIGIFDAPNPWGPWTTVLYESGWPDGGQIPQNSFYWNFSPKWWSADGLDFVLVFTGKTQNDSWNSVEGSLSID